MAATRAGSRLPLYLGVGVASAGGYYLYRAGGSPRKAELELEHDAARAKAKLTGSKGKEVEAKGKIMAADIGAKVDNVVDTIKNTTKNFDAKVEGYERKLSDYKNEVTKEASDLAHTFDKTVEQQAKATKKSWSDWFNGR